jgi:hypothetical protein
MRLVLVTLALMATLNAPLRAQVTGTRFDITDVTDTTISFRKGTAAWIRPGLVGIVVDPRQRDALVARIRIIGVAHDTVAALITGQTTRLGTQHVAILDEPRARFPRTLVFWSGIVIGFVVGAITGAQF